ncbi:hypothetical protein [Albibacterium profundi]|uniref:Uncharacterized protein n=1 Tax=Albibacterium profundi TaxID=3134906 RepID=A0ABV5CHN0_9SPHI
MKRIALTLPVLVAMMVLAQAQVKLNIKLYPVQAIAYNDAHMDSTFANQVNSFATTAYVINKIDRPTRVTIRKESPRNKSHKKNNVVYVPKEKEHLLVDVVYSIEPQ